MIRAVGEKSDGKCRILVAGPFPEFGLGYFGRDEEYGLKSTGICLWNCRSATIGSPGPTRECCNRCKTTGRKRPAIDRADRYGKAVLSRYYIFLYRRQHLDDHNSELWFSHPGVLNILLWHNADPVRNDDRSGRFHTIYQDNVVNWTLLQCFFYCFHSLFLRFT